MIIEARTQNSMFMDHRHSYTGKRWREWLKEEWQQHIDLYIKRGWHIIPLGYRSKKPHQGFRWSLKSLTREEALEHVWKRRNLGIVAGPSNLVLLDYDSQDIPEELLDFHTPMMVTPNGFTFFTREPYDPELFKILKKAYPDFDTPRMNIMYCLLPLSITCREERGNNHKCRKHDYRVREWFSLTETEPVVSFEEFVNELISCWS